MIYIDDREKGFLKPAQKIFKKYGFETKVRRLDVGDYVSDKFIVETKNWFDYFGSLTERLPRQLRKMFKVNRKVIKALVVIDERTFEDAIKEYVKLPNVKINKESIMHFHKQIVDTCVDMGMYYMKFDKFEEFVKKIINMEYKEPIIRFTLVEEQVPPSVQIFKSIPLIGIKRAKLLYEKVGCVSDVIKASDKDLRKIIGPKMLQNIRRYLQ